MAIKSSGQVVCTASPQELRSRTKAFALRIVKLCSALPHTYGGEIVGKQVFRSATSVAANYRATGRARSRKEFTARLGVVLEEIDETVFWLEMIQDGGFTDPQRMGPIIKEANELLAIFAASCRTARNSSS